MAIEDGYNRTFTIRRKTRTNLGGGRFGEGTPTVISSNVPGRWRELSASERERGEAGEAYVTHRVMMASSENVRRSDELVRDDAVVFEVLSINPISQLGHHLEVAVWEIETGT